jgi:hypothetical protein
MRSAAWIGRGVARYSTVAGNEDIVDVAIVGAGMVGAAVAALLRECLSSHPGCCWRVSAVANGLLPRSLHISAQATTL